MDGAIVIKLGGSLLYDPNLNVERGFISKLVNWFDKYSSKYSQVVIAVGGGRVSRHMVAQVEGFMAKPDSLHQIGMAVTNMNAELLKAVLPSQEAKVPKSLGDALEMLVSEKSHIVIAGGFKPGWSTDMNAAIMADIIGVKKIYKLSNIDHLYTEDPAKSLNARIIKEMTWSEYMKHFGIVRGHAEHQPGQHIPVGAHSAQFCAQKGLSFFVSGGSTLESESDLMNVFESGSYLHP